MFIRFFHALKTANIPVSLKEYLLLMQGLDARVAAGKIEDFYYLARTALVKDERNLDRFDQVFGHVFRGLEKAEDAVQADLIPEDWLKALTERFLTEEEKAQIAALGGFEKIMEELQKRLQDQQERHEGGSKWIGTAGTSPFGAYGYNPAGVRIGQAGNRNFRAIKVWDKREFRDLDDSRVLGTRNIKLALRRLRQFARTGHGDELDLDSTIQQTAHKGFLDLQFRPERENTVKVLAFFDAGGSMDWHIAQVEELFSAARAEFKHLEYYYFHNCLYEAVWRHNARRSSEQTATWDVLHTYPADYHLIFVGDASMSPYEITMPGGAVEHWNEEAGAIWLQRVTSTYKRAIWLNPLPEDRWDYTPSIGMIRQIMNGRMYSLTLEGLDSAIRELSR